MQKTPTQGQTPSLLGGAIGDAIGAGVEFMSIDSIRARYGPTNPTSDGWLPRESHLHAENIVRQVGDDLATGCKGDMDDPNKEWWEKYPGH